MKKYFYFWNSDGNSWSTRINSCRSQFKLCGDNVCKVSNNQPSDVS